MPLASRLLSLFHGLHIQKHFSLRLINPMGFMSLCKHFSKSSGVNKILTWSWGLYKAKRHLLRTRCCSAEVLNSHCCPSSCFHCSNSTPINKTDVLFLVSLYFEFKVQDFLTLFSLLHCFPAPPWTAHLQPPIPFTSRKGEAVFACSPNPCLSYEIRTETLWNFYFSSPAVQSGNTEQKEAFVFVVWFLKRNMDSSA